MQLSQKKIFFSQFVPAFLKSRLKFEHFQNMMTLIADVQLTPVNSNTG